MFPENFNTEESIRKWAKIIVTGGIVFLCLCVLATLILLGVDEDLWWISLIVFCGGLSTFFTTAFLSTMTWGFADIVGNTKKIASGTAVAEQDGEIELPEL